MDSDWIANNASDDPLDELYLRGYEEMARSISDASVAGVIRLLVSGVRQGREAERERDAYLSLLVQQTGVLGRWTARCVVGQIAARHGGLWWKDGVYQFPSYESAVAAVRAAAGLDVEQKGA